MLTKNYKWYCRGRFLNSNISGLKKFDGSSVNYYPNNSGGVANACDFGSSLYYAYAKEIDYNIKGVVFGTGSTPATEDDYTLEAPITSGLSISSPAVREMADDLSWIKASWVVTNTTDSDIVIREIGCFGALANSSSINYGQATLIERTVLASPITIPAGGAKAVTYRVDGIFNW